MALITIILAVMGATTALLSCATAYIALRREKMKANSDGKAIVTPSLKLLKFRRYAPGAKENPAVRLFGFGSALILLIFTLFALYDAPSLVLVLAAGFWGLCMFPFVFLGKRGGSSLVRRQVRFTIPDEYEAVFEHCKKALVSMNAKVVASDIELGLIYARTYFTLRSSGERIEVHLTKTDNGNCLITVVSDSLSSMTFVDFGKNADNLNSFIKNL